MKQEEPKQSTIHGNIVNVCYGASAERIVAYICITVVVVTFLLI